MAIQRHNVITKIYPFVNYYTPVALVEDLFLVYAWTMDFLHRNNPDWRAMKANAVKINSLFICICWNGIVGSFIIRAKRQMYKE